MEEPAPRADAIGPATKAEDFVDFAEKLYAACIKKPSN